MPARRKSIPTYHPHKSSGRARAVWTDRNGIRQFRLLPGRFESPESLAAFRTLLLEIETAAVEPIVDPMQILVCEVLLGFIRHAETHYVRADGSQTHEVSEYKLVSRYLRELYGFLPAREFGPLALKAMRQKFISIGWCRTLVNRRVGRVRRIFKWAASEELVPITVPQSLASVAGLQRGRCQVREAPPVEPVADAVVEATTPFLNRHVRGLVEFQRLTGCRPGEACIVRRAALDTGDTVWLYRPAQHKGSWRGKIRVIAIGPQAQALLREFFTTNIEDYLFSPRRAVAELHARRSATRRTPLYPSHKRRNQNVRAKEPKRSPAEMYCVGSYGTAVERACDKAFPPPAPLAPREGETRAQWWGRLTIVQRTEVKEWRKSHRWHPNQLRHSFATRIRKLHGLEAAQVLLGHSRADVTQVYAERNLDLATKVASEVG